MPTIGLPSMTYEELRSIVLALVVLSLIGGFVGGALYSLFDSALEKVAGYFISRADRASGGMGEPPMSGLTRPAYPPAWGRESLGRLPDHDPLAPITPCAVGRVGKRSDEPRHTF